MNFKKDRLGAKNNQVFWQGFMSRTHDARKPSAVSEARAAHEEIAVNLVNCRYPVVEEAVVSLGWKVVKNNIEPWDIFWSDAVDLFDLGITNRIHERTCALPKSKPFSRDVQYIQKKSLGDSSRKDEEELPRPLHFLSEVSAVA